MMMNYKKKKNTNKYLKTVVGARLDSQKQEAQPIVPFKGLSWGSFFKPTEARAFFELQIEAQSDSGPRFMEKVRGEREKGTHTMKKH